MEIHKGRLGDPEVDFSPVSGADGISLLTRLSRSAWSLSGDQGDDATTAPRVARFVRWSDR